jgi:hypothetical protein
MVKINAVKLVRGIRDSIYNQTKSMNRGQLITYYRHEAKKLHKRLGIQSKMMSKPQ